MTSDYPLVLKLQSDCIDGSVSTTTLLRIAKLVSFKLELREFGAWVDRELDGYPNAAFEEVPAYRKLTGRPVAEFTYQGWQPILSTSPELMKALSTVCTNQSIAELEALTSRNRDLEGGLCMPFSPQQISALIKSLSGFNAAHIEVSFAGVRGVIETVRNTILNWSLELERAGVRGEGLIFTPNERSMASVVTNNFYSSHIGVVGSINDEAYVSTDQRN